MQISDLIAIPRFPSTRYTGSKRKLSDWITDNISNIDFDTFLDAFGGTSSVGYRVKVMGKKVVYNDKLKFNYYIGKSIIENRNVILDKNDLRFILSKHYWLRYPSFIQKTFKGIYFTDKENRWLDIITTNIRYLKNDFKKSIAFNALFQSCLIKRPYNLFHRRNLYMRFAHVERHFGNKKTWDRPFEIYFKKFVNEINVSVFDNGRENKALNLDVFKTPNNFDVVYIDSPYMKPETGGIDYRNYYHFLEGLSNYCKWKFQVDYDSNIRCLKSESCINPWINKSKINDAFDRLFKRFQDSILLVSYRAGGIPSENDIRKLLLKYKDNVEVKSKEYRYALSKEPIRELLFIAK